MVGVWVVGAGALGARIVSRYLKTHPEDKLVAEKRSAAGSDANVQFLAREDRYAFLEAHGRHLADHVVYCVPPSCFSSPHEYALDVFDAIESIWSRKGVFLLVSSGGISQEITSDQGIVRIDESSPISMSSRLFEAEKMCLESGGCVVRLAGLYHESRGAHNYWLSGQVEQVSDANALINQIHYDDAATAIVALLAEQASLLKHRIVLISDGHPMSKHEIILSAKRLPRYRDAKLPKIVISGSKYGKAYSTDLLCSIIRFRPKFPSFLHYVESVLESE
jgi:nucleoside-diphosphate-sugar epimerase